MFFILILFSLVNLSWAQDVSPRKLYLAPLEQVNISVPQGQKISIQGKKIFNIEDMGHKIKITAKTEGDAQIRIGSSTVMIHIVNKSKIDFFKALNEKLKEFIGLRAEIKNGEVFLTGNIHRLSDWQSAVEIASEHSAFFYVQARLDADIKDAAIDWIRSLMRLNNLPLPHLVFEPELSAILPEDDKKIETLWAQSLNPLGIKIKFEKSQLATQPLVRVRIVVAEVNKKVQSQLGVEWPDMISATISPKLSSPDKLEIFLKAMEQNGLGQILASPNLLARSGSEADFLAGGEFGIKINTTKTKEVVWKRHGIYLKIKPQADRSGRLSIELSTEISLIDASQSVDGIPALKTNRMATHFDLSQPRTIVLSGLIRQDWGQSRDGIMGLSKLPILGALFRSDDYFNNKTELVIFVTPEIVSDTENSGTTLLPKSWTNHD